MMDAKSWPPIPQSLNGVGGPITIIFGKPKSEKGEDCWGTWQCEIRTIELDSDIPLQHGWWTLGHEMAHAVLTDTGLGQLLAEESIEALCDAFGTAKVAEMRGELGLP